MTPERLLELFEEVRQFKDIWIEYKDGQAMNALINGDVGWLMYSRYEGDPGMVSRNPTISSNADLDFILSNGQRDLYPISWTYPVEIIKKAMLDFISNGKLPGTIHWHEES